MNYFPYLILFQGRKISRFFTIAYVYDGKSRSMHKILQ